MSGKGFYAVILLISSIYAFSALGIGDVLKELPLDANIETQELARTYRNLCRSYNEKESIDNFNKAYEDFENAIFFPVKQRNSNPDDQSSYDPATFLERARDSLVKIEEEVETPTSQVLLSLLQKNIVPLLKNRIDLARLDKNIFDRLGVRASIEDFSQDPFLRQTLSMLSGRLFQVNITTHEILSTSTATMVSWEMRKQEICNLDSNCCLPLNSILTCAHALNSNEGRSDFYFIQSSHLDLETGFPERVNNQKDLSSFLVTRRSSFKIGRFVIKSRTSNVFSDIDLCMGHPQYFPNEDVVVGIIDLRLDQSFLLYNNNYPVSFKNNFPTQGDNYFALGYPGCDHYSLKTIIPLRPYPPLIHDMGISPLFITGSPSTQPSPVNPIKGIFIHRAPAAEGMSGGPLFYISKNRLNIFGVITEGEGEQEKGCYWF